MGGGGDEKQMTQTDLPAWAKPYAVKGLREAERLYDRPGPAYYPQNTVAPFAPETLTALEGTANRALAGSPLNAASAAETMKTLQGGYLEGNPYLDAIRQRGMRDASRIAGDFSAAGRTGSGAAQDSIAAGYTSAVAPYEYGGYENERARMQNAAQFAPQLAQQDYADLGMLGNVGAARQGQSQAEINADVARWDYGQNIDQEKLNRLLAAVYGMPGRTSVSTMSAPGFGLQQGVGAGIGLLGLAGQLGWSPFGSGA
jgi:hypothetical protein